MRLNLFFAFIISTFLCSRIVDAISLFKPQKVYWIYIIPAILLLLVILYKKLGFLKKTVSQIFLALFTSIPYMVFMFFIFLCAFNYPPEGDFEPKLIPEVVTEQEINAGNQLYKLLKEYENKIDTTDQELISKFEINDSNKSKIIELLNKTNRERQEVFEHISKNSIAIPHTFDTTKKYYLLSYPDDYDTNLSYLVSIFKLELLEVEIFKMEKNYDEAVSKYILSWYKLADAYKVKNTYVVDSLCFLSISGNLGNYYYNNQSTFLPYDLTEVAKLKEDIIDNLDRTYKVGFTNEYTKFKTKLENSKNIWPLMDRNKQLRNLDGFYYSMAEYERNPLNIVSFEEPIDFSSLEQFAFFKGFIGEVIYAINASMFTGLSANTLKRKNELSVYFYAMDNNNYQDIPLDYFTGEKFMVSDFPDRIEIDAHANSRLDSPKKYVIIK